MEESVYGYQEIGNDFFTTKNTLLILMNGIKYYGALHLIFYF